MATLTADSGESLLIDFSAGGNSDECCVVGWSSAEPLERWAVGRSSRLRLGGPVRSANYMLLFRLRPFTAPPRLAGQRLVVAVNGEKLASFSIHKQAIRAVALPWEIVASAPEFDIVFQAPDAAAPSAFGINRDDRVLSLAFASLALFPECGAPAAAAADGNPVDPGSVACDDQLDLAALMKRFENLGAELRIRTGSAPLR